MVLIAEKKDGQTKVHTNEYQNDHIRLPFYYFEVRNPKQTFTQKKHAYNIF